MQELYSIAIKRSRHIKKKRAPVSARFHLLRRLRPQASANHIHQVIAVGLVCKAGVIHSSVDRSLSA
jgi:hypothetical protein